MPCSPCPPHAITVSDHLWPAPPCHFSSSYSPDPAQAMTRRIPALETPEHARPVAPRHARASPERAWHSPWTRQSVTNADALASPQPSLSAPVDARRHAEAPRHGHLPAGTPQSTTTTPITRRGIEPSHQTRHRHRASVAPRSSASSPPVQQQPDTPMTCPFATLERRRRRRP